jgi:hypothetical protein
VAYIATDASNNKARCNFTIVVSDTEGPTLSCPEDVVVNSSAASRIASWTAATADDNVDSTVAIFYSEESGSSFDVGSLTTVLANIRFPSFLASSYRYVARLK